MAERQVKCKNCEIKIPKAKAYIHEYLTKNLEVKNRYYCSKKCCDQKEMESELNEKCYEILNDLLETKVNKNVYFNGLYKDIKTQYNMSVIYEFLNSEKESISLSLMKDFYSLNSKIKYFFAIMQNRIEKYKVIVNNKIEEEIDKKEINEDFILEEDDFLPTKTTVKNRSRSMQDIFSNL